MRIFLHEEGGLAYLTRRTLYHFELILIFPLLLKKNRVHDIYKYKKKQVE